MEGIRTRQQLHKIFACHPERSPAERGCGEGSAVVLLRLKSRPFERQTQILRLRGPQHATRSAQDDTIIELTKM
jgi:hypothetical protein